MVGGEIFTEKGKTGVFDGKTRLRRKSRIPFLEMLSSGLVCILFK